MVSLNDFVAQIGVWSDFPFPRTELFYGLCDGYAERGVAIENGNSDLDLCNLTVEVPHHEALAQ